MTELDDLLDSFDGISLTALDERAAYCGGSTTSTWLVGEAFLELARRLRDQHDVLEIDHRRAFGYSTTYFDTPDLRCFVDHLEDRVPRFKARTRFYEERRVRIRGQAQVV